MIKKIFLIIILFYNSYQISYWYDITNSDQKVINIFTQILEKKSEEYQNNFSDVLEKYIDSWKYNERIQTILIEINNFIHENLENINKQDIEIINNNTYKLKNIDIALVKNNWLIWNNQVRDDLWLQQYSYNSQLEKSAVTWSNQANKKWKISHKRNETDWFYNYENINNWFKENDVVCENINGITHTENIWWWGYSCTDWECSEELSEATKRAFDSYMNEKWTENDAHYRSLTQEYFKNIWLWISIDEKWSNYYEYYLTIHYCTNLQNK